MPLDAPAAAPFSLETLGPAFAVALGEDAGPSPPQAAFLARVLEDFRPDELPTVRLDDLAEVLAGFWRFGAEAKGARVSMESHSTRSEAAGDELDGPTLAKMFRAEARAAEAIQKNPEKYAHYIVEEAGGMIGVKDLKLSRILNAPPTPYTRERFEDNYNWTLSWGLVPPGATYENTVDNRAWQ